MNAKMEHLSQKLRELRQKKGWAQEDLASELCRLMTEEDAKPDVIASDLKEATEFILNKEAKCGNLH